MKIALSIGGSDSGSGAGIQADLKTLSALGVYGCTAITAITAQNTRQVIEVFAVPREVVRAQVEAIMSDYSIAAVKVGMVYSVETIDTIGNILSKTKIPIVLDPILAAGTGYGLLQKNALKPLIRTLIPLCTLVTPNRREAEKLSGIKLQNDLDAIRAAKEICGLGARNVIVKGGHMKGDIVTDILLEENGKITKMSNPRIRIKETHGSGCNFSAAATAHIAKGFSIIEACAKANEYVYNALKNTIIVGEGLHVTNPLSHMYKDAQRYVTLKELQAGVDKLVALPGFARMIPETQTNFVFALPDATDRADVAAVMGRIAKAGETAIAVSRVEFGASHHVANAVITSMQARPHMRSGINIRYDAALIKKCKSLFSVSSYDRSTEPAKIRRQEGSSISWGTSKAIAKNADADVIYHKGSVGKEPMITIFGNNPADVLSKVERILRAVG